MTGVSGTCSSHPVWAPFSSGYRSAPPTTPHWSFRFFITNIHHTWPKQFCSLPFQDRTTTRPALLHPIICVSGLVEFFTFPTSARILKWNSNLFSCSSESLFALAHGFRGRGLVVSRQAGLWKPSAWRNKTFKVLSVTLHFQPSFNIAGCRTSKVKNIGCYEKQRALRLKFTSKCKPPAWEAGRVLPFESCCFSWRYFQMKCSIVMPRVVLECCFCFVWPLEKTR